MVTGSEEQVVILSRDILFNRLIILSRPVDMQTQDVEGTNVALIEVLNEALEQSVISDDALNGILEYIQAHLEKVREHLGSTANGRVNLWRLHNDFCINLRLTISP